MRISPAMRLTTLLALCACATPPPQAAAADAHSFPTVTAPSPPAPAPPPGASAPLLPDQPTLTPAQSTAEADRLRTALAAEVPHLLILSPDAKQAWINRAKAQAAAANLQIDRPQLVVVVDRNPRVQSLLIMVANPSTPGPPTPGPAASWEVIGGTHVSTGQPNRKLYYVTPTGVFLHTADILDFRAQGTFNENHIRGYGLKGMRIWDFGWQWATKGWRPDGERGQIRLQLHATDPQYLEQRLGRPASEGCVRVPATLNRFLDRHGVLDVDYEQQATQDIRYRALLLADRRPSPLSRHTLIVIDSSGTANWPSRLSPPSSRPDLP